MGCEVGTFIDVNRLDVLPEVDISLLVACSGDGVLVANCVLEYVDSGLLSHQRVSTNPRTDVDLSEERLHLFVQNRQPRA